MSIPANDLEQVLIACLTSNSERRETTRTAIAMPITVMPMMSDAGMIPADLLDLSATGMGFVTRQELSLGECIRVDLPRVHQDALVLIAEVRYCRAIGDRYFSCGARFIEPAGDVDHESVGKRTTTGK